MKTPAGTWPAQKAGHQFFLFPITRIVLASIFTFIGFLFGTLLQSLLSWAFPLPNFFLTLCGIVLALAPAYFFYTIYVWLFEHRKVSELSWQGALGELGTGLLTGLVLVSLIIALLWLMGYYHLVGINPWSVLLPELAATFPTAFFQEIVFRAVIFRITERTLGTAWAMFISIMFFGALNLFIDKASAFAAVVAAAEAGVLLAAAYLVTRRLWFTSGIHAGWDFAHAGIFGTAVSGSGALTLQGLLHAVLTGPDLLTGGPAGIDSSLVALLVIALACVFLIYESQRKGLWIKFKGWGAWRG